MFDAAEDALRFANGRKREDIDRDRMLLRAHFPCIVVFSAS